MGKFLVRTTIILVSLYFLTAYAFAILFCEDILLNSYTLLFELCVVVYTFSEGKYHCKYMKWTVLSVFAVDLLSHLDYFFDFIAVEDYNWVMISILIVGISTSVYKAVAHFIKVMKLTKRNGKYKVGR